MEMNKLNAIKMWVKGFANRILTPLMKSYVGSKIANMIKLNVDISKKGSYTVSNEVQVSLTVEEVAKYSKADLARILKFKLYHELSHVLYTDYVEYSSAVYLMANAIVQCAKKKNLYFFEEDIENSVLYVLNSIEDGRIENILVLIYPGAKKHRDWYRLEEYIEFSLDDSKTEPVDVMTDLFNCILKIATVGMLPQGFSSKYANTDMYNDVMALCEPIAGFVTSNTIIEGMSFVFQIAEIIEPYITAALAMTEEEKKEYESQNKRTKYSEEQIKDLINAVESGSVNILNKPHIPDTVTPPQNGPIVSILTDDQETENEDSEDSSNGQTPDLVIDLRKNPPKSKKAQNNDDEDSPYYYRPEGLDDNNDDEDDNEDGNGQSGNNSADNTDSSNSADSDEGSNNPGNNSVDNTDSSNSADSDEGSNNPGNNSADNKESGSSSSNENSNNSNDDLGNGSSNENSDEMSDGCEEGNSLSSNASDESENDEETSGSGSSTESDENEDNSQADSSSESEQAEASGSEEDSSSESDSSSSNESDNQSEDSSSSQSEMSSSNDNSNTSSSNDSSEYSLPDPQDFINKAKQTLDEIKSETLDEIRKDIQRADKEASWNKQEEFSNPLTLDKETLKSIKNEFGGSPVDVRDFRTYSKKNKIQCPADIKAKSKRLRNRLQDIIYTKQKKDKNNTKYGMVDSRNLGKFVSGQDDFYKQRGKKTETEFACMIIKDDSGSMHGSNETKALEVLAEIEESFKGLGFPLRIQAFSDNCGNENMKLIKDWNDTDENVSYTYGYHMQSSPDGCNNDAFSIALATEILCQRKEKNKLLIVVSDGAPCCETTLVAKAVETARRKHNIFVISILIGSERDIEYNWNTFVSMYHQNLLAGSLDNMGNQLFKFIKKFIASIR